MSLTKRHAAALKRLFGREIENAMSRRGLPPAVKLAPKLAGELEELGLVEAIEVTLGGGLPVTISGHVLNWRGHITYCAWAAESCQDEDDPCHD
jgi:hypothetical protein